MACDSSCLLANLLNIFRLSLEQGRFVAETCSVVNLIPERLNVYLA